jgi:hypothetical protein
MVPSANPSSPWPWYHGPGTAPRLCSRRAQLGSAAGIRSANLHRHGTFCGTHFCGCSLARLRAQPGAAVIPSRLFPASRLQSPQLAGEASGRRIGHRPRAKKRHGGQGRCIYLLNHRLEPFTVSLNWGAARARLAAAAGAHRPAAAPALLNLLAVVSWHAACRRRRMEAGYRRNKWFPAQLDSSPRQRACWQRAGPAPAQPCALNVLAQRRCRPYCLA